MDQELENFPVPFTTTMPYWMKRKLEHLARIKANGKDDTKNAYIQEGLLHVFEKYGVTDEQIAVAS